MKPKSIAGGLTVARLNEVNISEPDLACSAGSVGVLGLDNNHWVLKPRWRDVLGEFAGYFYVQDHSGRWGVVSPDGAALTPFVFRAEKQGLGGSIEAQLITQHFLWWQYRSMLWTISAARVGSLAIFQGKMPKSYSMQMCLKPWGVRLDEPIRVSNLDGNFAMPGAVSYVWHTSTGTVNYGFDTQAFCPVMAAGSIGEPAIPIPWANVALALDDPETFDDSGLNERLSVDRHLSALSHLIEHLVALGDELQQNAVEHSDEQALQDRALDARILSEKMRGIAMNLLVGIEIPRNSGDLKNFTDQLPALLFECTFLRIKDQWPDGNIPEIGLRNRLENTLRAYHEWENVFLEMAR